jgi:hypothetical protein
MGFFTKKSARPAANPRQRFRPTLEALEDRTALSTISTGPDGSVYAIFGWNHQLERHYSYDLPWFGHVEGWQPIAGATDISQVSVGANGDVDVVKTDGTLWKILNATGSYPYWEQFDPNGRLYQSVAAGPNGEVYGITNGARSDANLMFEWTSPYPYANRILADVAEATAASNGDVYTVSTEGQLVRTDVWGNQSTVWNGGVHHVAVGAYGAVYFTWGWYNELYEMPNAATGYQWKDLGSNVSQISSYSGSFGVDAVWGNGVVYHTGDYYQYLNNGAWTY